MKMRQKQSDNVSKMYDDVAASYDESFAGKAEYQIPKILVETYRKYKINNGDILDVGCGTGKTAKDLGKTFAYYGIDVSSRMAIESKKRGYTVQVGPAEDIIRNLQSKSVDHIIAMSSLYFIENWESILNEFERVARKSIFVSLEQFDLQTIRMMKSRGINIYNHSFGLVDNPTEVIRNIFLWKRPNTKDRIYGDICFKLI